MNMIGYKEILLAPFYYDLSNVKMPSRPQLYSLKYLFLQR